MFATIKHIGCQTVISFREKSKARRGGRECWAVGWGKVMQTTLGVFEISIDNLKFGPPDACSVQFSSVAQSCLTLCDPMNCSTPGLPGHHQLLEFTQTHVHRVSDAIQPSHPLSSPSPPAPNPSQHQSLFQ